MRLRCYECNKRRFTALIGTDPEGNVELGMGVCNACNDIHSACPYCYAPSTERGYGDEGWTFCSEECGCIEGEGTVELTLRDDIRNGFY